MALKKKLRKDKMGKIEKDITLNELDENVKYYFEKRLDAKTIYRNSNTTFGLDHIKWEELDIYLGKVKQYLEL